MTSARRLSVSVLLLGLLGCAKTQRPPPGQPGPGDEAVVITYYYLNY
jgi:hypothetical protein